MTESTAKPLSEKPLGYILAIVAGTLGGPVGWFSSPLVLFGLTKVMKEKDGKYPNRFLAWAAIGIVGVPLSAAPLIFTSGKDTAQQAPVTATDTGSTEPPIAAQSAAQPQKGAGVTMANFSRIQTGMTYEQVVGILGEEGEMMSSNDIGGYKNEMYMWKAGGFSVGNMNAMFQNGALIQKSQFELK